MEPPTSIKGAEEAEAKLQEQSAATLMRYYIGGDSSDAASADSASLWSWTAIDEDAHSLHA